MVAVDGCYKTIVDLLTQAGCNINDENNKGETALYNAVKYYHLEAERYQTEGKSFNPLSPDVANVFTLLKAGAHLNDTSTGLNPKYAHVMSTKLATPSSYILKVLYAAGAEKIETETFHD